jgi:hypothetical protein
MKKDPMLDGMDPGSNDYQERLNFLIEQRREEKRKEKEAKNQAKIDPPKTEPKPAIDTAPFEPKPHKNSIRPLVRTDLKINMAETRQAAGPGCSTGFEVAGRCIRSRTAREDQPNI